jgi:hypothetical protein
LLFPKEQKQKRTVFHLPSFSDLILKLFNSTLQRDNRLKGLHPEHHPRPNHNTERHLSHSINTNMA